MIKKVFRITGIVLLLTAPLAVLWLKLPLKPEFYRARYDWVVVGFLYSLVLLRLAGASLAGLIGKKRVLDLFGFLVAALPLLLMLLPPQWNLTGIFAAVVLAGLCFISGILAHSENASAPAIASLLLTLSSIILIERTLDGIPEAVFLKEVVQVPSLAPADRGNDLYRKNGFRGQRPCRDCPEDRLRIFTMGGSSTFGTPMFYRSDAYAARLQKMLKTRRPNDRVEVINAGIPGYGITQIYDSINKVILKYHPDVITICAWFNDHSAIPGWYGYADKSDKEAYEFVELLRRIDANGIYRKMSAARSYGVFRHWMLRLQSLIPARGDNDERTRHRPRMSPAEFSWALEEIAKLGESRGFLPVIILEATNRTTDFNSSLDTNPYYRVIKEVSERYSLPLVNPLDVMAERRDEWLFYDFIHPNQRGHQIIAEALFKDLFQEPHNPKLSTVLKRHGIEPAAPAPQEIVRLQYGRKTLKSSKLVFEASVPEADGDDNAIEMVINDDTTLIQTGLSKDPKEFTFTFDLLTATRPIADITVRAKRIEELEAPEKTHGKPLRIMLRNDRLENSGQM